VFSHGFYVKGAVFYGAKSKNAPGRGAFLSERFGLSAADWRRRGVVGVATRIDCSDEHDRVFGIQLTH
jgi:hypothetical protein